MGSEHFVTILNNAEKKYFRCILSRGPAQNFLIRVESIFPLLGLGQVGSAISRFWKFPLKNTNFFNFIPSGQKNSHWVGSKNTYVKDRSGSYLLRMLGSGPNRAHLDAWPTWDWWKLEFPSYCMYFLPQSKFLYSSREVAFYPCRFKRNIDSSKTNNVKILMSQRYLFVNSKTLHRIEDEICNFSWGKLP